MKRSLTDYGCVGFQFFGENIKEDISTHTSSFAIKHPQIFSLLYTAGVCVAVFFLIRLGGLI